MNNKPFKSFFCRITQWYEFMAGLEAGLSINVNSRAILTPPRGSLNIFTIVYLLLDTKLFGLKGITGTQL